MKKILLLALFSSVMPVKLRITDDINFSKNYNYLKTGEDLYKLEITGTDISIKNNSLLELTINKNDADTKTHNFIYLGVENSSVFMYLLSEILESCDSGIEINVGIFGKLKPYEESKKD